MKAALLKRKRGRPRKNWPMDRSVDVQAPSDFDGRTLEGKEFEDRKKVLEAADRERRRVK